MIGCAYNLADEDETPRYCGATPATFYSCNDWGPVCAAHECLCGRSQRQRTAERHGILSAGFVEGVPEVLG